MNYRRQAKGPPRSGTALQSSAGPGRSFSRLAHFVRQGLRNREIAEQLGVTEGTVKTYLHAIFEKLGVSSRTELAISAGEFLAVP